MATAYFYTLAKRKNSTLQPTGGTSIDVDLKSGTSLISPTFLLNYSGRPSFNYVSYEGRYYFVRNLVSVRQNLWEIQCDVDVLATYKSEILNTTAYVIYDSTVNTELPDNRLPMKTSKSVAVDTEPCPFVPDGGCYILSLTGSNDSTGIYKVSENELADLIDDIAFIYDNLWAPDPSNPKPTPPTGQNVWEWIKYFAVLCAWYFEALKSPFSQAFGSGNIPENIRECRFIPFNVGITGGSQPIYLGTFLTQQSLGKLITDTVHRTATVNIPWQASDFRRRSPYTDIYLYLPYIGMVKLSSENLVGQSTITVDYTLSVRDGSMICTISSGGEILGQYNSNVGASVPVGISNINIPRAAQSVISGAANIAAKNIGGIGMSALNFGDAITPNFTCIGGLDGIASTAANQNITCYTVFHDTIDTPNQNLQIVGSPTMHSKSLATLTGFCQCTDAHISINGTSTEMDMLDGFINTGFYIE